MAGTFTKEASRKGGLAMQAAARAAGRDPYETRARISLLRKGWRHGIPNLQRTGPISAEHRANISAALRGRVLPPDVRAKISASKRAANQKRAVMPAKVLGVCVYCGDLATTLDHVMPRSRGGEDCDANKVLACRPCNSSKRDLLPTEWQGRKGVRT